MKYLVTGATGFIGSALCRQILRADDELLAYSASGRPLADGTRTRALDLASELPDSQSLAGVDAVLHLAGIAHRDASAEEHAAVNYRATIELAQRAARAGVAAFVYLSSVKAMGSAPTSLPRGEDECVPATDPYGRSKRAAELALADAFAGAGMSLVILRPALVYGPGAGGNLALLSRAAARGLPRPPEEGGRSMIGREDLVQLILQLAARSKPGVSTYIATDGEVYSTRRIYDALRRARGQGPGRGWCPRWGWRLACRLLDLRSPGPEPAWQRLFGTETYRGEHLRKELSWQPRHSLESALLTGGTEG